MGGHRWPKTNFNWPCGRHGITGFLSLNSWFLGFVVAMSGGIELSD
jgi:hypothetical protein